MKQYIACAISLIMFAASPSFSAEPPKLTAEQAQEIALKKIAGEVQKHEMESEDGKAVYVFEIKTSESKVMEVNIDGNTGEVLEIENADTTDKEGKDDNE